jgi:hypothetical protein
LLHFVPSPESTPLIALSPKVNIRRPENPPALKIFGIIVSTTQNICLRERFRTRVIVAIVCFLLLLHYSILLL